MTRPAESLPASPPADRAFTVTGWVLAATFGLLSASLIAAMAGVHHAVVIAPLAALITAGVGMALPRRAGVSPVARPIAVTLVVLALAVVVSDMALHAELVTTGRDGGTYTTTARFLIEGDGLFPVASAPPFAGEDLQFQGPGFVVRPDGTYYQQFLHSTPALYAFFGEIAGPGAIFLVNPLLAGIAVLVLFALARRFMTAPWALLATAVVAGSLPFAYYGRATFSEMATLVMTAGGVWAAHIALTTQPRAALGAGLLLGGATLARVDAWMLGIALGALVFSCEWLGEKEHAETSRKMFTGFAVPAMLGLADLVLFSEPYLTHIGRQLMYLIVVAVGLRVAAPLAAMDPMQRLADGVKRHPQRAALVLMTVTVVAFGYLLIVRPLLPAEISPGAYDLADIQRSEGVAVQPDRTYRELSAWWLVWYLGIPIVAAGAAGMAAAMRRVLRRDGVAIRFAILVFFVPAATYLIRPSINPDHIWAIRRFLPVLIPGTVIMAGALAAHLAAAARTASGRGLLRLGAALSVVPVALASAPLIWHADRPGVAAQMESLCESLDGAESVLIVDDDPDVPLSWLIGMPLRAWCGVSVAAIDSSQRPEVSADMIAAADPLLLPRGATGIELSATAWQSRVLGAPDETETRRLMVWLAPP